MQIKICINFVLKTHISKQFIRCYKIFHNLFHQFAPAFFYELNQVPFLYIEINNAGLLSDVDLEFYPIKEFDLISIHQLMKTLYQSYGKKIKAPYTRNRSLYFTLAACFIPLLLIVYTILFRYYPDNNSFFSILFFFLFLFYFLTYLSRLIKRIFLTTSIKSLFMTGETS